MGGCSRSKFADLNTNPDAVLKIAPQFELTTGQMPVYNNSFEAFYDFYQYIRPWTQLWVSAGGNTGGTGAFTSVANGNDRYNNFYSNVGPPLVDVQHLISIMPAETKAQYAYLNAITGINFVEYAFYVTDPNGSMPYSKAFQARYSGNLTPVWDPQQDLFDTLDAQLKGYIATLEAPQTATQVSAGNQDIVFQGNVTKWIMAANSLRLRMAMRLLKQNPTQLTAIANEVLADPVGVIDNTADEWVFTGGANFEGSGGNSNYNPLGFSGNQCLEKNVVDFMNQTQDPRVRALLQPSGITSQAMFDSAQAQGQIPVGETWDGKMYRGQYANPDEGKVASKSYYFRVLNFSFNGNPQQINYPSIIQPYILYAPYNSGSGFNVFPVITYADVCFMRAELVLRGLSNDATTAQTLYNAGVTASLQDFDAWAQLAQTPSYTALGGSEVANYLAQPGVTYSASTALEQVLDQEYLNDYMNPNEAWALIKRTGYPSPTGVIMPLEALTSGGNPVVMPRRYIPNFPLLGDLNYNNASSAISAELAHPGFGQANDITGKVWWDQ
jgi:hypothetical protein